jgi:hypothetical protein
MMAKEPDRLRIEKTDRELYDGVAEEVFRGEAARERKGQFLMAMAHGFRQGIRKPLEVAEGFVRAEYLRPDDMALINAVAVHEVGSVGVLADREEVFRIAEEYAHAGIVVLHDEVTSKQPGSFFKRFESDMAKLSEEVKAD